MQKMNRQFKGLFEANFGKSSAFNALNSVNKTRARPRFSRRRARAYEPRVAVRSIALPATHPLLVVGDDAADEVRVGVVQRLHQLAQLLLVRLADGAEHALARARPKRRLVGRRHAHPDDLGCGG